MRQEDELAFNRALDAVWQVLDAANKYIVATSPFTLAKDPARLPRVAQILVNLLEGLRVIAATLEPFMPRQAAKLLELLGVDESGGGCAVWRGPQARRSRQAAGRALSADRQDRTHLRVGGPGVGSLCLQSFSVS